MNGIPAPPTGAFVDGIPEPEPAPGAPISDTPPAPAPAPVPGNFTPPAPPWPNKSDGTRDTGTLGADPFGNVVLVVGGFDERETGLMPVRPPPAPVGNVTPPAPTVDVLGGVAPLPPLFNKSDGIGVGEPSSGAVPPPAALLRWFAELVRNGSTGLTGLTGPVVGEVPPPPAGGLDARETGLMVLVSGGVLPLPPLFRKFDGIRDGVPTVGDAVVLGLLVLGAVGNVLLGTEPGLRAACIAGFSFPGFSCVGAGVEDGVVDGSGEFTGAEANFVGLIGVLLGNVIRVGVGTGAFVGEFTRVFAGPVTGAEVNLVGVTGVLVGKVIGVGVVTGTFTGEFAGKFPRGLGVSTGEFTGELTGVFTGVVTGGVFGSGMRDGVDVLVCGPGPRLMGGVETRGRVRAPTVLGGGAVLVCGGLPVPGGCVRFGLVPLSGDVMFVVET
ncbi:hypothetical protein PBV52_46895 [Streptomyces sp. T12]|uniref:hypothetical protein n=1 Tax=Streptomyces sp. T12 TaxID=477697 RepID=UPI00236728A7|nr:hypothetical protein [Streptomyces sp. T12]WDF43784.1 hypothetical protein PBV52_46895 [Streptomyces sp. T12]